MGHPAVENLTPFAFAPLFVADEDGRPLLVTIVKGTFDVLPKGVVAVGQKQEPVDFAGKHYGEPGKSSVRFDPDIAFMKPGTDCVLLGHATSARPARQILVGFGVGPMYRMARVTGDRWWVQTSLGFSMTEPEPFERIPLVYERAFGGWDRTSDRTEEHEGEPRNPIGIGYVGKHGSPVHGMPLPNIEDPSEPLTAANGRCRPAGFGFVGPEWQPRASLAGTYDEAWTKDRAPLLPRDFDRRFFNAAAAELIVNGYLNGDEAIVATGVTSEGSWEFALPGITPPVCTVDMRHAGSVTLETRLDTVVVDADTRRVMLTWRAFSPLRSGPHDVAQIRIESANAMWRPDGPPPSAALTSVS